MIKRASSLRSLETACHPRDAECAAVAAVRRLTSETIAATTESLSALGRQLRQVCLETTRALVATVEAKDPFTKRHSLRVSRYAREIALWMGLPSEKIACVETAGVLHDIGKIGIPDVILNKPGPLLDGEFAVVRTHPGIGTDILGHTTYLEHELPLIRHHHERYDGRGYPDGLAGDAIPLGARVLHVADSLDAMLSRRAYKAPLTPAQARMELVMCAGKQFDPAVVEATLAWIDSSTDVLAKEL
jgi:HD-GYP domain-containing protein (c-di-GMP phosphodiesterase class II)